MAPTDALAQERGREGLEFFGFGLTGGTFAGIGKADHHLYREFLDFKSGRGDTRAGLGLPPMMMEMGAKFADLPGMFLCGPEKALEQARQIEATHADGLLINHKFGWTTHEHQMESLEIWGKQILPEFREREPQHQAWRQAQLEAIDLPVVSSV